ncbi:MAG: methylthioribulose 1-phosphate dehydratase [Crocinitomicaceae bacterium]|nr:methylthioribulose 1-phosphate dehydratase [Crocinitomicaceae bacterium]
MNFQEISVKLAELIVQLNNKGWSAATGTNYSFLIDAQRQKYWVSISGKDKSCFAPSDFMEVLIDGSVSEAHQHLKPSAENLLHATIYELAKDANVVLHSHSANLTVLSGWLFKKGETQLKIEGYEVQKAIGSCKTHEAAILLPIFENTQDMEKLSKAIQKRWDECEKAQGFAISKHGFYTWGKDLPEAKRHLEAYEFLFDCIYKTILLKK